MKVFYNTRREMLIFLPKNSQCRRRKGCKEYKKKKTMTQRYCVFPGNVEKGVARGIGAINNPSRRYSYHWQCRPYNRDRGAFRTLPDNIRVVDTTHYELSFSIVRKIVK